MHDVMTADRGHGWPRFMDVQTAAAYFSLDVASFDTLGLVHVQLAGQTRYDRAELDRFAKRYSSDEGWRRFMEGAAAPAHKSKD